MRLRLDDSSRSRRGTEKRVSGKVWMAWQARPRQDNDKAKRAKQGSKLYESGAGIASSVSLRREREESLVGLMRTTSNRPRMASAPKVRLWPTGNACSAECGVASDGGGRNRRS